MSPSDAGFLVSGVNLGAVAAFLLVWRADRWGRKRLLTLTILGYTVCTVALGVGARPRELRHRAVPGAHLPAGRMGRRHGGGRPEEFPAARRGLVIGTIQAFSTLGSVTCAGLAPLLLNTPWGWRSVYFVSILPLVLVAWARRGLKETERFQREGAEVRQRPFTAIWSTAHRQRLILLSLVWMLIYACSQNAITFWKEFAIGERGFTDADVGQAVTIAAIAAMPLVFFVGKVLDSVGRRPGAVLIFGLAALGTWGCYSLESRWALTAALALGVFGATAVLPVLSALQHRALPDELPRGRLRLGQSPARAGRAHRDPHLPRDRGRIRGVGCGGAYHRDLPDPRGDPRAALPAQDRLEGTGRDGRGPLSPAP